MRTNKISLQQQKTLKGFEKEWGKLIDHKIKMNTELVVLINNKIVNVHPEQFRNS